MTLGNRIKNRREELGMTQIELAEKAQLRQNYISKIENDKFEPTAPTIISLAVALDMSADELLGLENKKAV